MIRKLKGLFDWIRKRKIRVVDFVFAILLFTSYILSVLLGTEIKLDFNFNEKIKIDNGYFCVLDKKGGAYVIDKEQTRLCKIENNKFEWEIVVGAEDDKICKIENVVVDDDGNVYVHETHWDETGWVLDRELINKYGPNGKYLEQYFIWNYYTKVDCSMLYDLRVVDGHIEYIKLGDNALEVCKIVGHDELALRSQYLVDTTEMFIQTVVASPNTNNIYILDMRGKIFCVDGEGNTYTYYNFKDDVFPCDIVLGSDESIYFTDLHSQSVSRISDTKEVEEVFSKKSVFQDTDMDSNKGVMLYLNTGNLTLEDGSKQDVICGLFDSEILYAVRQDRELVCNESVFDLSEKYLFLNMITFVISIIFVLCAVLLGIRLIFVILFNKSNLNTLFLVEIVIVVTTAIILITVLPLTLSSIQKIYINGLSEKITSLAQTTSRNIDPEKLRNINKASDFMNDDYKYLYDKLNIVTFNYDKSGQLAVGGIIEKFIDGVAIDVIYAHIRTGVNIPVNYTVKQEIMEVFETKKSKVSEIKNFIGKYLVARSPIVDSNGEVVGCVCIEQNMSKIEKTYKSMIRKITIDVLAVIILGILIVNEAIVFVQKRKEYKRKIKKYSGAGEVVFPYHTIRLADVIFSMSLNISYGFLPIYALSLYTQYLSGKGVATVFAASWALSINIAFIFLSSIVSLSVFKKFGFKKVIIFAVCCSLLSSIMLAQIDVYSILILALALHGLGYGLLSESKRIYLSKSSYDELNRVQVFCSPGAGSGKFLGLFIGGFLAITFEYSKIFWVSVLIDIVALGFCIYFCKTYSGGVLREVDRKPKMSALKSLLSKRNLAYLAIIPFIWGIISGFAGYYMPICGLINNFYRNEISLSLFVVGFFPAFFASGMTKAAINKFGTNSIYVAILTALGAMLLLFSFNQLLLFIISLSILGISYSFGLDVGRHKFKTLINAREYDENKVQNIYTLFYAIGAVVSPQLFGYMLARGIAMSMWCFAIVVVVIMIIYKIFLDRKNNVNR